MDEMVCCDSTNKPIVRPNDGGKRSLGISALGPVFYALAEQKECQIVELDSGR
jgi:hypothetical protein